MSWLKRLFALRREPPPLPALPALEARAPVPPWALELQDAVQKVGRAQARTMARIEALESKVEGGFSDLRSSVPSGLPAVAPSFEEVLDSMDILDEASRTLDDAGNAPAAQGLRGVVDRLQRFLAGAGLTRIAKPPAALDGKVFRVVGVVERHDLADGTPAQVVRAAALAGDRVVREGEVLVNRRL